MMKILIKKSALPIALIFTIALSIWINQKNQLKDASEIALYSEKKTFSNSLNENKVNTNLVSDTSEKNELSKKSLALNSRELLINKTNVVVDLFKSHQWILPMKEDIRDADSLEHPPKIIPAIPFLYLGKFEEKSGLVVHLLNGDVLLTVSKGEVIDQTYRLDVISDSSLVFTYLPQNIQQTLHIKRKS